MIKKTVPHFAYSYGWNNNTGNLKLHLNNCKRLWISPVNTFKTKKILYAGLLNYKPSYSEMESENGIGWMVFLIGFCIIDSFCHFLPKTQLSCSILIIMLPAKLCTAWIALLCLERIKNYVLGRVKVFHVQVSEWEAALIFIYQSIKNTLFQVLHIRIIKNSRRVKKQVQIMIFCPVSLHLFEKLHCITHLVVLIITRFILRHK